MTIIREVVNVRVIFRDANYQRWVLLIVGRDVKECPTPVITPHECRCQLRGVRHLPRPTIFSNSHHFPLSSESIRKTYRRRIRHPSNAEPLFPTSARGSTVTAAIIGNTIQHRSVSHMSINASPSRLPQEVAQFGTPAQIILIGLSLHDDMQRSGYSQMKLRRRV